MGFGRGGRRRLDCRAGVRGEGELRGRTASFLLRRMGGLPPWPFSASDNGRGCFKKLPSNEKVQWVCVSSQIGDFGLPRCTGDDQRESFITITPPGLEERERLVGCYREQGGCPLRYRFEKWSGRKKRLPLNFGLLVGHEHWARARVRIELPAQFKLCSHPSSNARRRIPNSYCAKRERETSKVLHGLSGNSPPRPTAAANAFSPRLRIVRTAQ